MRQAAPLQPRSSSYPPSTHNGGAVYDPGALYNPVAPPSAPYKSTVGYNPVVGGGISQPAVNPPHSITPAHATGVAPTTQLNTLLPVGILPDPMFNPAVRLLGPQVRSMRELITTRHVAT